MKKFIICHSSLVIYLLTSSMGVWAGGSDPWRLLQERYRSASVIKADNRHTGREDPWKRLRAIYLPFTVEQESAALTDPLTARKISKYLYNTLRPYEDMIHEAADRFNIPKEIIGAVIMVESGGDPRSRAKTSTAKGLMQTISSTFREAHQGLRLRGIPINDNPFDPYASIMAGSWYLDQMYIQAAVGHGEDIHNRGDIRSWRYPVEYYYAGPGNGKKERDIVIVYKGGRRIVIDKPAYSRKVLRWARIMKETG